MAEGQLTTMLGYVFARARVCVSTALQTTTLFQLLLEVPIKALILQACHLRVSVV